MFYLLPTLVLGSSDTKGGERARLFLIRLFDLYLGAAVLTRDVE